MVDLIGTIFISFLFLNLYILQCTWVCMGQSYRGKDNG